MTGFLRKSARTFLRWLGRWLIEPLVIALAERPSGPELPVSVHILVSSKTWRMGLLAILSLEYFSGKRWKIFLHEDGSLDTKSLALIAQKLPGARLVSRHEADQVAENFLVEYPVCLRSRGRHNLFLKFFDPIAFAPGEKFLILDADLFFYRRPDFLLDWATSAERTCHYNRDVKEVYCLPRQTLEEALKIRLWEHFNSGLLCLCREVIDLPLSEKLLHTFESSAHHPQFFEQTLYALCCSAWNQGGALPVDYEITWEIFRRCDSVCRHYVGPAKFDHLYFEGPISLLRLMSFPSVGRRVFRMTRQKQRG